MKYSLNSKLIHWSMSFMIISMLLIGFFLDDIPVAQKAFAYTMHKSTGLLLMILVIIRLAMRLTNKYPSLPDSTPKIIVYIAKWNVFGLYLMMILMPLSGFLMSSLSGHPVPFYGLFSVDSFWQNKPIAGIFHELHQIGGCIFVLVITGHILGGLFHHFILKDDVLKRMI